MNYKPCCSKLDSYFLRRLVNGISCYSSNKQWHSTKIVCVSFFLHSNDFPSNDSYMLIQKRIACVSVCKAFLKMKLLSKIAQGIVYGGPQKYYFQSIYISICNML